MKRDLKALADREFDLVVVGVGVYGAAIAWDAIARGLSVALVDKEDFGGATSFNNLKTVHGGLRYLQHADFRRMRESIRERRTLMRIAPHLVHPLAFVVPTYREWKRGRLAMSIALWLNDRVGFDRNRLPDTEKHLAPGRLVSRAECLDLAPGVRKEGLTGGAIWYDAQMANSERMTLSFVLSAAKAGAQVANHLEVIGFLRDADRLLGVRVRDRLAGQELEIRARVVVNAAGPWVDRVLSLLGDRDRPPIFHFSKAMNLVTRPVVERIAVGVSCRRAHRDRDTVVGTGARFLFLIPWRGLTLVGTRHTAYRGEPDDVEATEEDIQGLLEDVNEAYPGARLGRGDVRLVHRGLLPEVQGARPSSGVTLVKKYIVRDHRGEGIRNLITVVGVKYTTARDVAEKAVDRVFELMEKKVPASVSATTPLYGGNIERFNEFLSGAMRRRPRDLDEAVLRHLVHTYGSAYEEVLSYVGSDACWGRPVSAGSPVLRAEVLHAVREEEALDLASVLFRRTELGSAGHPGRQCLETVSEILARELGWSEKKREREMARVEEIYRLRS